MTRVPRVEQHVRRPRVEAADRALRWQVGDVGDAAQVGDDAVRTGVAEHRGVECGNERGAMATRRDVAHPEIRDHRDVRLLGDARRVVELRRPPFLRTMAHRLAMDARGNEVVRLDAGCHADGPYCMRVQIRERIGRTRRPHDFIWAGDLEPEEFASKLAWKFDVRRGEELAAMLEVGDNGVDAVEARPGHHAGVKRTTPTLGAHAAPALLGRG